MLKYRYHNILLQVNQKWNKRDASPVVNRSSGEESLDELPAQGTSRNLAAKFRELEGGVPMPLHQERKPVRKITPPREELSRSIIESQVHAHQPDVVRAEDPAEAEDELPPAEYTKNIVAKFRSFENLENSPPSPVRPVEVKRSPAAARQYSRPSPDSGISDNEKEPVVVNSGYTEHEEVEDKAMSENNPIQLADVVRESDKHDEEELPEHGFTRSLVAQWRNMEATIGGRPDASVNNLKPKAETRTWNKSPQREQAQPVHHTPPRHHTSSESSQDEGPEYENVPQKKADPEVIHADDHHPEDELPAPSTTKNMLARFQSMQEEAAREKSHVPPSKKVGSL